MTRTETGSRGRWWARNDTRRLLARAEHTNHGPITEAELFYMLDMSRVLLYGPLRNSLADHERAQVEQLHAAVLAALGELEVMADSTPEADR